MAMFREQAIGCPNKFNIYHDCSDYCVKKFGAGTEVPPVEIKRKYNRLLKSYPLSENWRKVWEPGTCRYYFWNIESDEVSWYPPRHPNFKLCLPVPKLKAQLKEENEKLSSILTESSEESGSEDETTDSEDSEVEQKKRKTNHHDSKSTHHDNSNSRRKLDRNDLDPMDPASYSEFCPRGKWSDGLENSSDPKSGHD